ncbi:hypothetical protein AMYX_14740 [Anaeromyxobacter diazotrophicus]|uniref:Uncharacterized protein n=1 Tax=Anaeromyxobacter diazotrophicus TaxID=2590199 RepID=A0A7I9VK25_9BACT|nr:hypothetical protein AMYX_14740 [Anaeromyxobacter diazotrophicus]
MSQSPTAKVAQRARITSTVGRGARTVKVRRPPAPAGAVARSAAERARPPPRAPPGGAPWGRALPRLASCTIGPRYGPGVENWPCQRTSLACPHLVDPRPQRDDGRT